MRTNYRMAILVIGMWIWYSPLPAQLPLIQFGTETASKDLFAIHNAEKKLINWIDVNTSPQTWRVDDNILSCSGTPIGVMRSEKEYENFILHVEWKHKVDGGNSGIFIWSRAIPDSTTRLPDGVEVQMLELQWVNMNKENGK